jgi:polysaccharide biosynthesis transport protein
MTIERMHPAVREYDGAGGGLALQSEMRWTQSDDEMRRPRDVWGVIRRNLALICGCVILAAGAAALSSMHRVPIYEAWTTLRIDEKQSGVPALDILQGLTSGSEVSTEQEILASRSIAEDVADSLTLQFRLVRPAASREALFSDVAVARDAEYARYQLVRESATHFVVRDTAGKALAVAAPGQITRLPGLTFQLRPAAREQKAIAFEVVSLEDAVDELRGAIAVDRPNRDVSIVEVRYRGTDPALVRAVPNAVAARFIARRQAAKHEATQTTVVFLRDQSEKLAVQLRSAENALRAFREREGVVNLPEQARTQIGRVADLQAQRSALETERSALGRLMVTARSAASKQAPGQPSPYRDMLAFPTLLRNQAASQLLASLTAVEDRRVELLSRRSASDPDVQLLTSRTADLEEQLRRISETYLQGLTDQIASIDATLAASEQRLGTVPSQEVRLARLTREAKGLEDIYAVVGSRLREAEIAVVVPDGAVRVIDPAVMPRSPVEPRPLRAVALALAVGLMFGTAAAFAREHLDKSVHSRRDVQTATGLRVLGLLPAMRPASGVAALARRAGLHFRWRDARRAGRAVMAQAAAVASREGSEWGKAREAFNGLHAGLSFATAGPSGRMLIVASPLPGDGKTTVAVNLATTMARQGQKVLLVDGDMRRGMVHRALRLPRAPGLSDILLGASDLAGALRTVQIAPGRNLCVLVNGTPPHDPADVLGPTRLHGLLERTSSEFDWVIVDTPPLNIVVDAAVLSGTGAAVVLVARAGVTPAEALVYAVDQLRGARATVIGAVLNAIDKREASYDSAYSYYEEYGGDYREGREASVLPTFVRGASP